MRIVRSLLVLAVALLMVCPALAQEKKGGKRGARGAGDLTAGMLRGVTLTDEQKTKVEGIKKEYGPKVAEAMKKADVRTDEQKKAAADAEKAARDAGKSRREIAAAARDAVKLTDEQKAKQKEARQAMMAVMKEVRGKVMDVLTQEQKDQVQKNLDEMKKGFGGRGKKT